MKKLISLVLTLMMVFSMSTVAFADEVQYTKSDPTSFTITKTYESTESFVPGETLAFTITPHGDNPTKETISIGSNDTFEVTGLDNTITVTVPSYTKAGVYNYTITEQEGNTAGVTTYDTTKTIHVVVLVAYDNTNHKLVIGNESVNGIQVFIESLDGKKTDEFINEFKTNDFTVAKDVRGNMANENDEFEITVTLTTSDKVLTSIKVADSEIAASAWTTADGTSTYTKTLTLSEADGAVTFADVPYGVSVSVVETDAGTYDLIGYEVDNEDATETARFTIDDDGHSVVVVNEFTTEIDTGISMDSIPFILMLAICAVGAVLFISKRRRVEF